MKQILINKEIGGWGITANELRAEFEAIGEGEDVQILIDSPGGSCYEMVSIFNLIRDFARDKTHKIETYIQGMAASCASLISSAAKAGNPDNKIIVEDNSVFMIHNCWSVEIGDHRQMERSAKEMSRIDDLMRSIYKRQTKKSRKELSDMMDEETWLYGHEIIDNGFADEIKVSDNGTADGVESTFDSLKQAAVLSAKNAFNSMQAKIRNDAKENPNAYAQERTEAAACLTSFENGEQTTFESSNNNFEPETSGNEECLMTLEELKAKEPALCAALVQEGADAERQRVQSHLKMASDSGDINAAVEFINSGVNCSDNACVAKYHETFTKCALAKARAQDTVPETNVPPANDEASSMAVSAFMKETGLEA